MKKVLILHAWFATPTDHFYPWVKDKLEDKGFKVIVPQLKDKDKPTLKDWKRSVSKACKIDKDTIVIGHSLGSVLALKIAESLDVKIRSLILVAGWDYWDLTPEHKTFFAKPVNHKKIINHAGKIIVIHADNDPYVTAWQAGEFAKRLKAIFILLKNKGHFTKDDGITKLPEVVKAASSS